MQYKGVLFFLMCLTSVMIGLTIGISGVQLLRPEQECVYIGELKLACHVKE